MNKILLGIIAVIMASCSSAPFKANVDNELLVGKWTISNVDDAAAMVSKEEFLLSAMHEKYKEILPSFLVAAAACFFVDQTVY